MIDDQNISSEDLFNFVEKIEFEESQKEEITNRIKNTYEEVKISGFDPKVIKQVIKHRKMETSEIEKQETLLDLYKRALGMIV
jgi:uncharacterized protein (UPF0335 family)